MVVLGLATPHHDSKIADTFAQQLGWVFFGPCHPSAHGPPAKLRGFTSLQMVHTHIFPIYPLYIPCISLWGHSFFETQEAAQSAWNGPFQTAQPGEVLHLNNAYNLIFDASAGHHCVIWEVAPWN